MKKRLYISNDEAGFFDNNKMLCLDNPPTQGDFIVGDIVISSRQQDGIFGWVCVQAGSPGVWEVIVDLSVIENAIKELEARDEKADTNIAELKNKLTELQQQALLLAAEQVKNLNSINTKITNNLNKIEANTKDIAANLNKIEANTKDIVANKNSINEINNNIETMLNEPVGDKITTEDKTIIGAINEIHREMVNNKENGYFVNNKINIGDGIPTEGTYNEGDVIISNKQFHDKIGWICVKSGTPGVWEPIFKVHQANGRRNNQTMVSEFIGVARSYYKVRRDADGNPIFNYNANATVFDEAYVPGSDNANSIDCSTFIGLALRGISFEESPYALLIDGDVSGEGGDDEADNGSDEGDHNEFDDIYEGNTWDPLSITANPKRPWAFNLSDWMLPKTPNSIDKPLRTASQIGQWMYEMGWAIPLDPLFTNLEPGDIIFWAKTSNGAYSQPNRYQHISHIAMCMSKYDRPVDDPKFPEKYPWKHTMLEVSTKSPYVLNRTLEKCRPEEVVMICRPDFGSLASDEYVGNLNTKEGIDDVSDVLSPGFYYLTSKITKGLPEGIESGIYLSLKVERSMTRLGKPYSLIQTLVNAKNPDGMYIRTQYCYSHAPNNTDWTDWIKLGEDKDLINQVAINTEKIAVVEKAVEQAVIKAGSIESTMEDNSLEIENIKKGLVNALVSHGVNANVGMAWKELFELVLGNASSQPGGGVNPIPGELILYKNGAINDNTEFGDMLIDTKYLLTDYIDLDIDQDGAMLWFGFNGKVDFSKYESAIIEIKNVAEHASKIGISRNASAGFGYERGLTNFNKAFMKGKDEVIIEEGSKVVHTLSFADLYADNDKDGYFGIYVTREAGVGGTVNDEIIINSITIIPKPLVPCTGLSLNKSEIELNVGGNPFTLIPTVLPADCTDVVVWKSTNSAVATVDQNGVVTPKAVGTCNIRVTCGEITVNCAVIVNAAVGSCTGITIKKHPIIIEQGKTIAVDEVYEILPAGCIDEVDLTFTSVISIANGIISGDLVGSTTLTIKCGNHTASLIINVTEPDSEEEIEPTKPLVIYEPGYTIDSGTEFGTLVLPITESCRLTTSHIYTWLAKVPFVSAAFIGYNGDVDFSKYEYIDITLYGHTYDIKLDVGVTYEDELCDYGRNMDPYTPIISNVVTSGGGTIRVKMSELFEGTTIQRGHLLIGMSRGDGSGQDLAVYITKIVAYRKEERVPCTRLVAIDKTFAVGDTFTAEDICVVIPENTTDEITCGIQEELEGNDVVSWRSTTGKFHALSPGIAKILIRCGNQEVTATVTVGVPCTSLTAINRTYKVGDTFTLDDICNVSPSNCTETVQWGLQEELIGDDVVSWRSTTGKFHALSPGIITISLRCGEKTALATITVEDAGNGIVLYRNGTVYEDTEFRNICIAQRDGEYGLDTNYIYYNLSNERQHVWFSFDGYIDFSKYDRVDVRIRTAESGQQPNLGIGITSKSGQYSYTGGSVWEGTSHAYTTIMTNKTETTYSLKLNYTGSGYLLFWMNNGETNVPGGIYITEIVVHPKETAPVSKPCIGMYFTESEGFRITGSETLNLNDYLVVQPEGCTDKVIWVSDSNAVAVTDGIVTVLAGGSAKVQARCGGYAATASVEAVVEPEGGIVLYSGRAFDNTEFGDMMLPTAYIDNYNGKLQFDLSTSMCTWGAFCYESRVNFNNYDAVAITMYTENTQQKNTQIMVGRGANPTFMIGYNTGDVSTVTYEEATYITTSTTIEPATYVFNFADLRKESDDMGYLGIRIKKGDADGKVYISKIVVYRDGEYYTESINE